ncbi:unnamed protein product [Closterium sp. NIES-64]|nr:unnamed protein product [Closterium sp. NIES-64]
MDLVSDGRREGGEDDLHAGSEPRPHPSSSGPWNLARGQQGEGGRRRDDADVVDSSDSASKADGKEEADEILMARDGKKDDVAEQERGEWSKDADKDGSLVGMCGGCAKQRGSADAGLSADELRESSAEADRAPGEVRGSGARRQGSSAEADRAPGEVRGSGARRQGSSAEAVRAPGEVRGSGARRQGSSAEAVRAPEEVRGSGARRQGSSAEADRAPGEVRGSGARRPGSSVEADRAPGDVRGSGARRRKSKENDCATGRMRGEGGPPELQSETERRRRMEMGVRRSLEPWDEEEDRRELRRRNALPWEVPEEESRGKAEKEELRRRNDEQYRRRERSPEGKTGSEKEEYERGKPAGRKGPDAWERERLYREVRGSGARRPGSSVEADRAPGDVRGSGARRRKSKENDCATGRMPGEGGPPELQPETERRRRMEMGVRRSLEPWDEEEDRRELRRRNALPWEVPEEETRGKAEKEELRRRNDERYRRRERSPEGKTGSEKKEYERGKPAGRKGPDAWERERLYQENSPEKKEGRWEESEKRREAYEGERGRSPLGPRRSWQSREARAAREGLERVLDGRRKQVSKVGAWACMLVTPAAAGAEERDKPAGAKACVVAAAEAEGKNEKVGAWADAPEVAGTEGKNENVGAWADEPEAAGTEGKDEKVGAWAAAEGEDRDEKKWAGACGLVAAGAEGKNAQVGAGACVTAAAKPEEKEEQVGAGACVPAVAEAEGKDEKVGARSCVLKAEKQMQRSRMAKQHVRKLRRNIHSCRGRKRVKEAVRRAETGVRSMQVEMMCDWGQGDLRIGGWEGPVGDEAQEQEEAKSESKEVGTWECRPAGEEVGHTMEVAMSQEGKEAVKTVRWSTRGIWAAELMQPATQVLPGPTGMKGAENWVAWKGAKAAGHLRGVQTAAEKDLHTVQAGNACEYEQRQQQSNRRT